jgi:hypothetical protein
MQMNMARNPDDEYRSVLAELDRQADDGRIADADAKAIKRLCYAFDEEDARGACPPTSTKTAECITSRPPRGARG